MSTVRVAFEGAAKLRLDNEGNLFVSSNGEEVKHCAPAIYQQTTGDWDGKASQPWIIPCYPRYPRLH